MGNRFQQEVSLARTGRCLDHCDVAATCDVFQECPVNFIDARLESTVSIC